ncbi:hypothetical protein VTN02DRAFT_745 [Thermoascus thermophilus]
MAGVPRLPALYGCHATVCDYLGDVIVSLGPLSFFFFFCFFLLIHEGPWFARQAARRRTRILSSISISGSFCLYSR